MNKVGVLAPAIETLIQTLRLPTKYRNILNSALEQFAQTLTSGLEKTLEELELASNNSTQTQISGTGDIHRVENFDDIWFYSDLHYYTINDSKPSIDEVVAVAQSPKHNENEKKRARVLRYLLGNLNISKTDTDLHHKANWPETFVWQNIRPLVEHVNKNSSYYDIVVVQERIPYRNVEGQYMMRRKSPQIIS